MLFALVICRESNFSVYLFSNQYVIVDLQLGVGGLTLWLALMISLEIDCRMFLIGHSPSVEGLLCN
jgi:hypothetical protein